MATDPSAPPRICFLADCPQYASELGQWFFDEWRPYYGNKTVADVTESIRARAQKQIPFALVAMESERPLGTVSLKHNDLEGNPHSPWLAGLYVCKSHRGKGLGTHLVNACLDQARCLGVRKLFLWTPSAKDFFRRLGWHRVGEQEHCGSVITIMVRDL